MAYTKIKEIGRGGFGRVFEVQNDAGSRFALKEFEPNGDMQLLIDKGFVKLENLKGRFKKEVKYQSQLDSKHIVHIIDSDLDADRPWFVMELAVGTLQDDLNEDRSLGGDPSRALFDILAGLEEIHKRDIVHRDLKPVNVLKLRDQSGTERYAISDFGLISTLASETTTLTQTGHGGGTPVYAAPELITKFSYATPSADIYSVGAILHDIFDGSTRTPYLEQTTTGPCREIVEKCTKTNAARRYQDVASLRDDIYKALVGKTLEFKSNAEKELVELLQAGATLADGEWDRIYNFLSRPDTIEKSKQNIFSVLTSQHFRELADSSAELLNAIASEFSTYVRQNAHNFDYCDVLADKIEAIYECGSISIKAHCLITLLIMGVDHNRYFVENKFIRLASAKLDGNVAERIQMDITANDIAFAEYIARLQRSIGPNLNNLHPILQTAAKT